MTDTDVLWADVEVAVTQQPGNPDEFRVIFERGSGARKAKLATVYVDGREEPQVTRFSRNTGIESGLGRKDYERKAVAVVQSLADAMTWE